MNYFNFPNISLYIDLSCIQFFRKINFQYIIKMLTMISMVSCFQYTSFSLQIYIGNPKSHIQWINTAFQQDWCSVRDVTSEICGQIFHGIGETTRNLTDTMLLQLTTHLVSQWLSYSVSQVNQFLLLIWFKLHSVCRSAKKTCTSSRHHPSGT